MCKLRGINGGIGFKSLLPHQPLGFPLKTLQAGIRYPLRYRDTYPFLLRTVINLEGNKNREGHTIFRVGTRKERSSPREIMQVAKTALSSLPPAALGASRLSTPPVVLRY